MGLTKYPSLVVLRIVRENHMEEAFTTYYDDLRQKWESIGIIYYDLESLALTSAGVLEEVFELVFDPE